MEQEQGAAQRWAQRRSSRQRERRLPQRQALPYRIAARGVHPRSKLQQREVQPAEVRAAQVQVQASFPRAEQERQLQV